MGEMVDIPQVECPLLHFHPPGVFVRQITMPKGSLILSRMHHVEHAYTISKGSCRVWTAEDGVQDYVAPWTGITKPGTVRILFMHEDTVWTTYHPNPDNITDPDEFVNMVTSIPVIQRKEITV